VSISILSNTLGEQYSRKNSKRIQIVIIFNVVHPGQSRECFDDVVKEMPEMENDINELFCPTWKQPQESHCANIPSDHQQQK